MQAKESIKQENENAAFARLETSRLLLLEKIKQYPGQGRKVDVLEELNNFTWKFKQRKKKNVAVKRGNGILVLPLAAFGIYSNHGIGSTLPGWP